MKKALFFLSIISIGMHSLAQVRKTPEAVSTAFSKQYPGASNVRYEDNLLTVKVHFTKDSSQMVARYNSDGAWKETDQAFSYDSLSGEVKDGFQKSRYAVDWKVDETDIIFLPHNVILYRIKVEKNDVQKKYLFFDRSGRLVKESLTI